MTERTELMERTEGLKDWETGGLGDEKTERLDVCCEAVGIT